MSDGEVVFGSEEGELDSPLSQLIFTNTLKASFNSANNSNALFRKRWIGVQSQEDYMIDRMVGEGTFGQVFKAHPRNPSNNSHQHQVVALKALLLRAEQEGFPITAIREIKLLKNIKHPNIIELLGLTVSNQIKPIHRTEQTDEVVGGQVKEEEIIPSGVSMIFPYMEHDLTALMEDREIISFSTSQIKLYIMQLLSGVEYLHRVGILHRDIKGANLLLDNRGQLKITDFGLARPIEEGKIDYTPGVVTRWYRPPELLLGARQYGPEIDIWGIGCILAEMYIRKPLLPGASDLEQLERIIALCGMIDEESMPGSSTLSEFSKINWQAMKKQKSCSIAEILKNSIAHGQRSNNSMNTNAATNVSSSLIDLINQMLCLNPKKRISAKDALEHAWFKEIPRPALPHELPSYKSRHDRHMELPHPIPQKHGEYNSKEGTTISSTNEHDSKRKLDERTKYESKRFSSNKVSHDKDCSKQTILPPHPPPHPLEQSSNNSPISREYTNDRISFNPHRNGSSRMISNSNNNMPPLPSIPHQSTIDKSGDYQIHHDYRHDNRSRQSSSPHSRNYHPHHYNDDHRSTMTRNIGDGKFKEFIPSSTFNHSDYRYDDKDYYHHHHKRPTDSSKHNDYNKRSVEERNYNNNEEHSIYQEEEDNPYVDIPETVDRYIPDYSILRKEDKTIPSNSSLSLSSSSNNRHNPLPSSHPQIPLKRSSSPPSHYNSLHLNRNSRSPTHHHSSTTTHYHSNQINHNSSRIDYYNYNNSNNDHHKMPPSSAYPTTHHHHHHHRSPSRNHNNSADNRREFNINTTAIHRDDIIRKKRNL